MRAHAEQSYFGALDNGRRAILAHAEKSRPLPNEILEAAIHQARVDGYTLEDMHAATGVRPFDTPISDLQFT